MFKLTTVAALGVMALAPTLAQSQVISSLATLHGVTEQAITATAEMVSEELYSFQPTEEVRTLGQILAHVADGNYSICSAASGQENPASAESIEQTRTSKSDIQQALAEAFAYCRAVYESMSDETGAETVPFFDGDMARAAILAFNSGHSYEHYGNLVTYMRLNGIIPPTSMPQQ